MKRAILSLAALACLFAATGPAAADPIPAAGLTPTQVANWLHRQGLTATVAADPVTPTSESIVKAQSDGMDWSVYFLNCDDTHHCASMQYAVGFLDKTVDASTIANWNSHWRFIRAYLSQSGHPWGEMDLDIAPGASTALLDRSLSRWRSMAKKFKETILPQ